MQECRNTKRNEPGIIPNSFFGISDLILSARYTAYYPNHISDGLYSLVSISTRASRIPQIRCPASFGCVSSLKYRSSCGISFSPSITAKIRRESADVVRES